MKVGLIGNTKVTKSGLERLLNEGYDVTYVFGLPEKKAKNKVNYVPLEDFCYRNGVIFDNSNEWANLVKTKLDLVICLGDSRIVPEDVLSAHKVIGNHGAILPYVQGGASYVWGRMLNTGKWGISIMELDKVVDSGRILVTKEFSYSPDCTMEMFCDIADSLTVEALFDYLNGSYTAKENAKWDVKVARHTDSEFVIDILKSTLNNNLNIYLPPRRPKDSRLKEQWKQNFMQSFKKANNGPYPRWFE